MLIAGPNQGGRRLSLGNGFEGLNDGGGRCGPTLGVLGHQLLDQIAKRTRHIQIDFAQGRRLMQGHGFQDPDRRGAHKGLLARGHLIKHAAQAEQVAALVNFLPIGLFRGHVGGGADHGAGVGQVTAFLG